jgi:hypothetical protein
MSKDNFNKFLFEYIPKHPELGLENDKLNPESFAQLAVTLGPKAGFSFTKAEVDEVLAAAPRKDGPLSDKHLDAVSGGAAAPAGGATAYVHQVSLTGTAMCPSLRATSEVADEDWMFIKGEFLKGE